MCLSLGLERPLILQQTLSSLGEIVIGSAVHCGRTLLYHPHARGKLMVHVYVSDQWHLIAMSEYQLTVTFGPGIIFLRMTIYAN